jgi:hypothetical protein
MSTFQTIVGDIDEAFSLFILRDHSKRVIADLVPPRSAP